MCENRTKNFIFYELLLLISHPPKFVGRALMCSSRIDSMHYSRNHRTRYSSTGLSRIQDCIGIFHHFQKGCVLGKNHTLSQIAFLDTKDAHGRMARIQRGTTQLLLLQGRRPTFAPAGRVSHMRSMARRASRSKVLAQRPHRQSLTLESWFAGRSRRDPESRWKRSNRHKLPPMQNREGKAILPILVWK